MLPTDSARALLCLGSVCIEDCKRTQQPPALLSEEADFGVFGSGRAQGRLLRARSGQWCKCSSHFLNSLQGFPLCVCVLNLSCIMQKCVFLNFFHSGHENYAFLTCFLISVAIFLIQMISMDREFTQQIALGLDLVVNLYPVLP